MTVPGHEISIYFLLLLLLFVSELHAAPFDDSEAVRQEYDEFRQKGEADGHQPITSDADMVELYLVYAQKALDDGEAGKAFEHLQTGKELAPDDGRFSMLLGHLYSRTGDDVLAESYLRDAVRQLPGSPEPLKLLADHYYRVGQLPDAATALQDLLLVSPDDGVALGQLEKIQREIGVEADMVRDVNSIFSIKFDESTHADLADRFVEILQEAYAEQGSLLDFYPQKTIQVILYTRDDYDMTTGAPAWSAGRFDGKIRLPVSRKHVEHTDFRRILHHEYNHFIAQLLSRGRAPAWFYEGLAMIAESGTTRELLYLPAAYRAGKLMDFSELARSFDRLDAEAAYLAYEQSYSFVNYLLQQFGWHTLKDLLLAFGQQGEVDAAFASVFSDFGLSYAQLQTEWLAGM